MKKTLIIVGSVLIFVSLAALLVNHFENKKEKDSGVSTEEDVEAPQTPENVKKISIALGHTPIQTEALVASVKGLATPEQKKIVTQIAASGRG